MLDDCLGAEGVDWDEVIDGLGSGFRGVVSVEEGEEFVGQIGIVEELLD